MFIVLEKFLKLNNFSRVISEFEDYYQSHPNFPSLFALTDTFSSLNIENIAARVDKDHFDDLPETFLGYVAHGKKGVHLALVNKRVSSVEVTFEGEKPVQQTIESFKEQWNGIVVAIEPEKKKVGEPRLSKNFTVALFAIAAIGAFSLFNVQELRSLSVVMYSLYVLGMVLSIFIIQEKLNTNQGEVSRICSIGNNTSCDSVIKSDKAKLTKWIDFSDLGILFYGSSLVAMLIDPASFIVINWLSILSLPLLVYSVWLQRTVLKTWCVLCLALSALLLVQASLVFYSGGVFPVEFTAFIFAGTLVGVAWFFLRFYLVKNKDLSKDNTELLRFKRDFEIFQFLHHPLQLKTSEIEEGKVRLGAAINPIKLSIVISPSCGHCHAAFKEALKLYQENPDRLTLEIFYNLNPENRDNPYLEIAQHELQIVKSQPEKAIEALSDWHVHHMDRDEWLQKWRQAEIHGDINNWLMTQYDWCVRNEFNYTPVIIINDSELSRHYTLGELKYFLSELSEPEDMDH